MDRVEIGPYRLLRRLGAGGMGEVYLAERAASGGFRRRCCVKLVLPHLARRPEIVELFEREAVLSARVSHENVVQVFDYGRIDDVFYLAMEYIDGVTARRMVIAAQERKIEVAIPDACAIAADVARGLAAVHALTSDDGRRLGVVHRDVTPDNILVTRDGLAKLGDFGIAVAEDSTRITQTGELRGKMPYLSPEQLDGGAVSPASDVFMLGVTLFQLIAGKRPFDRGTDLGTMNAIVTDPAPPLDSVRAGVPRTLSSLVASLLEKDPQKRPAAAEVTEALLKAVPEATARPKGLVNLALATAEITAPNREPETSVTEPSGPAVSLIGATQPERRPRRWLLGLVVGTAVAMAGSGGAYVFVNEVASEAATESPTKSPPPQPEPVKEVAQPEREAEPEQRAQAEQRLEPERKERPEQREQPPEQRTQKPPRDAGVPSLHLVGPANVRWTTTTGRSLGNGDVRTKLAAKNVVAVDGETGGRSLVPIVNGVARYDALGKGTVDVRAEPYANVMIGARSYGVTPIKPAPQLVEGTYRVKLSCEGREKIEQIEVRAGEVTRVRVDLSAP